MASSVVKGSSVKNIITRNLATRAVAATQQEIAVQPQGALEFSFLPKGGVVASVETNSPVSSVALFLNSGSRFEDASNRGTTHMAKICAGIATMDYTTFGMITGSNQFGGFLQSQNGRDHMMYGMSFLREEYSLTKGVDILANIAFKTHWYHWEVMDTLRSLNHDLSLVTPSQTVFEMLHEAAFRYSGLGNSVYIPDYNVGKITHHQLRSFAAMHHTSPRMVVVGLGVDHNELVHKVSDSVGEAAGELGPQSECTYYGGEVRRENGDSMAYIAMGSLAAKLGSPDVATLAVLQQIFDDQNIVHGSNPGSQLHSFIGDLGSVCCINQSYADAGLFGFAINAPRETAGQAVKAVLKGVRSLKVTEDQVKSAKTRAKAAAAMIEESKDCRLSNMGLQYIATGKYTSPKEFMAEIDAVSAVAVQSALSTMNKSKPSLAAYGGISEIPYLDHL